VGEAALRTAILDPGAVTPPGLTDGDGRPAPRRFAVYRNNVVVSLTEALEVAFPAIAKLVGTEFYKAMAGTFVRAHPPRSPLMMLYGAEFPDFLAVFPPVAHLPYLADVARLEQAVREAYHAADGVPVDPAALTLAPDALAGARLRFAPAVRLVRSQYPVYAIWLANTSGGPKPLLRAEDALVTRPEFDPVVTPLAGSAPILEALIEGIPVGRAIRAGPDTELEPLFAALLAGGAITAVEGGAE
jgi:hypothetical protein